MGEGVFDYASLVKEIEDVYNTVRSKFIDLWWLDQGDAPVIKPLSVSFDGKKLEFRDYPKTSLKHALRELKNSVELLENLPDNLKFNLIREINVFYENLSELLGYIVEANKFVSKIVDLVDLAKSKVGESSKEFQTFNKAAYAVIDKIKNVFLNEPAKWKTIVPEIEKSLESLRVKLDKLKVEKVTLRQYKEPVKSEKDEKILEEPPYEESEEKKELIEEG